MPCHSTVSTRRPPFFHSVPHSAHSTANNDLNGELIQTQDARGLCDTLNGFMTVHNRMRSSRSLRVLGIYPGSAALQRGSCKREDEKAAPHVLNTSSEVVTRMLRGCFSWVKCTFCAAIRAAARLVYEQSDNCPTQATPCRLAAACSLTSSSSRLPPLPNDCCVPSCVFGFPLPLQSFPGGPVASPSPLVVAGKLATT